MPKNGRLVLLDNPTNYEVWHELSHFRQYQKLGKEAYLGLPRSAAFNAPEQFVFDTLEIPQKDGVRSNLTNSSMPSGMTSM